MGAVVAFSRVPSLYGLQGIGAQPTAADVRALEKAHKEMLLVLIATARTWQTMSQQFAYLPNTDPRKQRLLQYGVFFRDRLVRWLTRQNKLVQAGVEKTPIPINYFFDRTKMPALLKLAKDWDYQKQGIGFIPLIVWGVVALVGFFTADSIVDELNTTSEERESLMSETAKQCRELNLNSADCARVMNTAQQEASSGGGSTLLIAILAAAGFLLLNKQRQAPKQNG